jgi:hypothetical protein
MEHGRPVERIGLRSLTSPTSILAARKGPLPAEPDCRSTMMRNRGQLDSSVASMPRTSPSSSAQTSICP